MPNACLFDPGIVIVPGCMFSGKTEELVKKARLCGYAGIRFQTFLPAIDTRADRSLREVFPDTISFSSSEELIAFAEANLDVPVMIVDEDQFGDENLPEVFDILARKYRRRVIGAGLPLDYLGKPFGPMPKLLTMATELRPQYAVCFKCGRGDATRSQRRVRFEGQVLVGSKEAYEARCITCFDPEEYLR
jgi:thymidine kinase